MIHFRGNAICGNLEDSKRIAQFIRLHKNSTMGNAWELVAAYYLTTELNIVKELRKDIKHQPRAYMPNSKKVKAVKE